MIWKIRSTSLALERPFFMGIVNITPDSFHDASRHMDPRDALQNAQQLVREGANLIDLGAESTRPNAAPVSEKEELARLIPVLELLVKHLSVPISVDTTKAEVARRALACGAEIVNDVSGLKQDLEMAAVVKEFEAGVVLMHRRGTPQTMQSLAHYEDVMGDVLRELKESMNIADRHCIDRDQLVMDPGIGFSKTAEYSLELLNRLQEFQMLGRPILVGPSRKSFIGAVTGSAPENRLAGTISACVLAYERGARIFRVHDVAPVKEAMSVAEAILEERKVMA